MQKRSTGQDIRPVEVCPAPTLAELGVTKQESHEAQRLARIPEDEYEQFKATQPTYALNTRQALDKAREVEERRYAPVIDAAERDLRIRRARTRKLLADAYAVVADLHCQIDDVVDAAQADDADRHVSELNRSARLLTLIAERVDTRQLRRVK